MRKQKFHSGMFLSLHKYYHQYYTYSLIMITIIMCLLSGSLQYVSSSSNLASSAVPTDQIVACLTSKDVNNFTTFPSSTSSSASASYYYKTLNFSIQNLRYAEPWLPKPMAIVMPESTEQLRSAVLCSREAHCRIIVRSGGHSYEGTSSVATPPFVVIDLVNLDAVSIDVESETAWVEAGATLGQTYRAIAEASPVHAFSAGSCPTVGVGGHIAGGGFGLLSRKYGLAADNVVDALLFNADGRLLDRRGMGEEVFWAIRGGGGGVWGIVYAWKIKLLRVPPIITAFAISRLGSAARIAQLVQKWQNVAPSMGDDFYLSCFVGANLPGTPENYTGLSATFKGLYLGPKADLTPLLIRDFPELAIQEGDGVEMSWIESVIFFSGLAPGSSVSELGNREAQDKACFKAKSDYVQTPISYIGIRSTLLEQLTTQPKGYVILDPYGGIMDRISSESIAFPHRKGNLYSIQYMVEWQQHEDTAEKRSNYMNWIRSLHDSMADHVSSSPRAAYINYMDFDLGVADWLHVDASNPTSTDAVDTARVWGHKYFLDNFDRMVRAKTLIDPLNVFTNSQGIPPISNAVALSST